jgi:hypothetical protein
LKAGEIIVSKLKREDVFDIKQFRRVLLAVKENINSDFLRSMSAEQSTKLNDDIIARALELREKRRQTDQPKDKLIRDLRVYCHGLPDRAIYPYDYQYTQIFLSLLQQNGLKCPTYHHLYIHVVKSYEDGLICSSGVVDWQVNGIAVIDYERFIRQSEKGKEETVFNLIVEGLRDITAIDKLDDNIIEKVISEVKEKGLDTELIYGVVESKTHSLIITYLSRSYEEQCPIFFTLTEKGTLKTNKIQIGRADKMQIYLWLQKVTLTSSQIKIKSSQAVVADVWLKDKMRELEFNISDILN